MTEEKKTRYNQKKNVYVQEYIRQNYDQVSIRLPKEGEITREKIATAADRAGMSTNAFIIEGVSRMMQDQVSDTLQDSQDVVK